METMERRSGELMEGKLRRTPTWHAKCRMWGSGKPSRFEHWGARGDYAFYLPVLQRSKLLKELHKDTRFILVRATVVV